MSDLYDAAPASASLTSQFQLVAPAEAPALQQAKPAPFSLRLSADERALLEDQAGSQPLGAYIRARLFGDQAATRRTSRRPVVDHQKLGQVLAALGHSRLSQNMNQLAKAANMGTLNVSPGLSLDLREACKDIRALREMLIAALGLRAGDGG